MGTGGIKVLTWTPQAGANMKYGTRQSLMCQGEGEEYHARWVGLVEIPGNGSCLG